MAAPGQELPIHGGRGGEAQDAPVGVPLTHADVLSGQTPHAAHRLLLGFFNLYVVSGIHIKICCTTKVCEATLTLL